MFLPSGRITRETRVTDIVDADYRTSAVFRKHGIEYCCSGKWPLETACLMKGLPLNELLEELETATRVIHISPSIPFHDWSIDFMTDYIVNIHHYYLKKALPELSPVLADFVEEHIKKDPRLGEVLRQFNELQNEIPVHLKNEEELVFPYIRQLSHAYESNEPYASLLVKTLGKPSRKMMEAEHDTALGIIYKLRELTDNYTTPEKSCTNHRAVFSKLRELDNDLTQHAYLENRILFQKALSMEKEILLRDK